MAQYDKFQPGTHHPFEAPRYLTDEEYLRKLRVMLREAVKETQRLDAKWNRLNDELTAKFQSENVVEPLLSELKGHNVELSAAFSGGVWWRDKAVYLSAVIQAELAMKEAGL